jgi:ATP-dependent Clp protease ATP-binding subunit ClpB
VTEAARELIAREGYDPVCGARPLRRFIQHEVETRIARALLSGDILEGATVVLDAEGEQLLVTWRNLEAEPEAPREMVGAGA